MATKTGKCINIDCDNYKQEVEVVAGEEFECPLCHQHLEEVISGKKTSKGGASSGKKKMVIIMATVVVFLGGGAGLYFGLFGNGSRKEPPVMDRPPVVEPVDTTTVKDSVVTTDPIVDKTPLKEEKIAPESKGPTPEQSQSQIGYGTINLGYGSYTGDLKNGQPHGHGTITYTQSRKIVNSKDFVANPGDTFEGDFREGRISSIGYWTHNGNKTAVKP